MKGELSISYGKEADHLLHRKVGCHFVSSRESIELQRNLDCKEINYCVQSSSGCSHSWILHNLGNHFQSLRMGKIVSLCWSKILPVATYLLLFCCALLGRVISHFLCSANIKSSEKRNLILFTSALLLHLEYHSSNSCFFRSSLFYLICERRGRWHST